MNVGRIGPWPVSLFCFRRTGPGPTFCTGYQPRGYGILFDVLDDSIALLWATGVVIVRFRLPESPGLAQELIGCSGSGTLEPTHQHWHGNFGQEQYMDVIGHDDPGAEFVE